MTSNTYDGSFDDEFESDSSAGEQIDLQHYLRILRKNKWPITIFTAFVTMLAAYYAYTATPIYQSTSTLLIESQKANIISIEELYGVDSNSGDYYQTQYELLRSRALAARVVKRLGLDKMNAATTMSADESSAMPVEVAASENSLISKASAILESIKSGIGISTSLPVDTSEPAEQASAPEEVPRQDANAITQTSIEEEETKSFGYTSDDYGIEMNSDLNLAISRLRAGVKISPVRKTTLVKISYASPDPEFSALVANVFAEEYILSVLDGRMKLKEKASSWMSERIALLKANLDSSENRLIRFKEDNGLIDVNGSVGRLNEQELLLATTELAQARSELSDARDLYREVNSLQGAAPELLETVPAIQNDLLVRSVKIEFGQRQREFDELSNRYGLKHPKIVDAQSRLDSLRGTLDGHIFRVVGSIQKDFQLRRQRVSSIQATLSKGKENIQIIGQKKFKLDGLEREVATNRDIYNQLFRRITETNSSDGLDAANARISDFAVPENSPIKPKKQLIIALAMLAGLVLSMLMAFLYEQMDETIKGTNDVEKKLGIKMLGILPLINKGITGKKRSLPLNPLEIDDKKGTFIESVNTTRTVLSMNGGATNKVILVTSSIPGEGKSTTAINLAYSFSQLERVLLVDCDLRRPSLAKAIGSSKNVEGLSNLITDTAPAKVCIRRSAIGSLDILTSGPLPQQPLELLSSNRFAKILQQLTMHYDKIIIDSAPTQAVSDSLVLSKLADTVVYVVKSHDTSYQLVKRGLVRLQEVGANVAGVLVTQVDVDKIVSYGGDYYYQGYYDYYGYTDKDAGKNGKSSSRITLTPEELRQMKLDDEDVVLDLGKYVRSAPSKRINGHAQEDGGFDQEFDLTTQVQSQSVTSRRAGSGRATAKFDDDFDLV